MDKIWDRKSFEKSEVIGRCGGDEKNPHEWLHRTDKSRMLKKNQKSKNSEPLYIFGAMFKRI